MQGFQTCIGHFDKCTILFSALGLSTLSDSDDMLRWETATAIEVRINRGLLVYKQIKRQVCNLILLCCQSKLGH